MNSTQQAHFLRTPTFFQQAPQRIINAPTNQQVPLVYSTNQNQIPLHHPIPKQMNPHQEKNTRPQGPTPRPLSQESKVLAQMPNVSDQAKRRKIPIIDPKTGREIMVSPPPKVSSHQTWPRGQEPNLHSSSEAQFSNGQYVSPTGSPSNAIQKPFPVYINRASNAQNSFPQPHHTPVQVSILPSPPPSQHPSPNSIFLSNSYNLNPNHLDEEEESEEEVDKYEWTGLPNFGAGISLFEDEDFSANNQFFDYGNKFLVRV